MRYQQQDKNLIKIAKQNNDYSNKHFHGADKKYSLICRKHRIVIPKQQTYVKLYTKFALSASPASF